MPTPGISSAAGLSEQQVIKREDRIPVQDRRRVIARFLLVLLTTTLAILQGCARPLPPVSYPVPPTHPAPTPDESVPSPELPGAPVQPPARKPSVPVPAEGKAAAALLASARGSMQQGQPASAEMTLERALRIEPRNARLWQEMAQVKFAQKQYDQAVQLAVKSNSLAGRDYDLIRGNWLLMEKAHRQLGQPEKAEQARRKAEE